MPAALAPLTEAIAPVATGVETSCSAGSEDGAGSVSVLFAPPPVSSAVVAALGSTMTWPASRTPGATMVSSTATWRPTPTSAKLAEGTEGSENVVSDVTFTVTVVSRSVRNENDPVLFAVPHVPPALMPPISMTVPDTPWRS